MSRVTDPSRNRDAVRNPKNPEAQAIWYTSDFASAGRLRLT